MRLFGHLPAALLAAASCATIAHADPLDDGFRNPPQSARPRVWWHWMNGNVTEEGIKLDLEWMKRIGIGGVQTFDAQLQTPQVVEKRLVYMTPEWKEAFRFAARTADRLGLEMAIAASPGWSESGGPWVRPEDGMKKLVWSETDVMGGHRFSRVLAMPPSTTGPFQDLGMQPEIGSDKPKTDLPTLYRDTHVLAYRVIAPDAAPTGYFGSSGPLDGRVLNDGKQATAVHIPVAKPGEPVWLRADFAKPRIVRSATLGAPPAALFGAARFQPVLEASEDGITFSEVGRFPNGTSAQYTITFPPVTARAMRVIFLPDNQGFSLPTPPAPGAEFPVFPGFMSGAAPQVTVAELHFSASARTHRFEEKAGYATNLDYYGIASPPGPGLAPADVLDLTGKMAPDGRLTWSPPKGCWRILRMGWSLTGTENHPATPEATGFEVDKFDAAAVRRYINTYLDTYVDAAGVDLIGARGVQAVLNDSIEVGASNWTPRIVEEFIARRHYDPVRWLPALTGVIIDTPAKTDAFLYDFRRTLADLMADAHYRTITSELHKRGLIHYSESLEDKRPSLGDDMDMRRDADIPMAAMWSYSPQTGTPQPTYQGDIRGAASVAHIYGQNLVAAESLTSALQPWAFAPRDLQPMIDMEFALGVNRPIIHTSVHQPLTDKFPGFSLFIFGQYFNRLETWSEMAKPWVDYISRNSFMLQQGHQVADVAYFYGEEAPLTALFAKAVPDGLPQTSGFDFVNADVVLNQLTNDGTDLVAKGGARYKLITLGGTSRKMTLPVLLRLEALVQGGATLVGLKPEGTPSLSDDPAAFAATADRLWGGATGKGQVLAIADVNAAMAKLGIAPDFAHSSPESDTAVMFVHRAAPGTDIYYFTNRKDRAEKLEFSFRVTGRRPELWDAATGTASAIGYTVRSGQTVIPMTLRPYQSGYIVFRQPDEGGPALRNVAPPAVKNIELTGPWALSFQTGRGAPAQIVLPHLIDWSRDSSPGVRYFSGIGTYRHELTVPGSALKPGKALMLDLGDVRDVAEVIVNGRSAGTLWKPPYRLNIAGAVKAGKNDIEIRVANLWVNRLIGDAQPGAVPITFTTLKTYTASAPLRSSGLLGPVSYEVEGR